MAAFGGGERGGQQVQLSALAAAVDALDGNEPAKGALVELWTQTSLTQSMTGTMNGRRPV
jgi:hypothetical protein